MSQGIEKVVTIAKESAWGVKASNSSAARNMRRVTAAFQGEKDAFASNEIRTDQQMVDSRHGTRRSTGSLSAELAGGAYDELFAAALRRDFTAGATTGAVTIIEANVGNFERSSGSFVSDGFNVGTVISVSGFTSAGNNGLFYITGMTSTVLSVAPLQGQTMTIEIEGDSVTILEKGQKTFVPSTGHTDDSFTVEEWHPDTEISRIFLGEQVDSVAVSYTPNSMVTVDFAFLGKDAEEPTDTRFFTSATAINDEGTFAGQDGLMFVNGTLNGKLTSLNVNLAANIQQEAVLGSTSIGAKSRGKVMGTYDATAIFDSDEFLSFFNNETEVSIGYVVRSADQTEAFAIYLPRAKVNSATTDDGEKVIIVSFSGEILKYVGSAVGVVQSTILVQDTVLS